MRKLATSIVAAAILCSSPVWGDDLAIVAADGTLGIATKSVVHHPSTGEYDVSFSTSKTACALTATPGSGDATVATAGSFATTAVVRGDPFTVVVTTYDASGQLADQGFHLITRC